MSTTYTIYVLNKSGFKKSYVVFMEPPLVTTRGGSPEIFQNAWATFTNILDHGYDYVTYTDETYACWSTTPLPMQTGGLMGQGGFKSVDVAAQEVVQFVGSDGVGFASDIVSNSAMTGSFAITTGTDFTASNGFALGLARPGKLAFPTPVATFAAQPNEVFNVTPVVRFYVSDGSYTPGQVIDVTKISATPATIDFTGRAQVTATVLQEANGSFSVIYT